MKIQIAFAKLGREDDILQLKSKGKSWSVTFTETTNVDQKKIRFLSIMNSKQLETYLETLFLTLSYDHAP